MPLFRFGHNWDPFGDLEREVDRLLHSVNLTFQGLRLGRQYPSVNLYERDDEYILTAELPGAQLEDLELTFAGGILTLKGRRDDAPDVPENRFRRCERFRGSWQRAVSLPERVREEGLKATFTDGVLKVRLPKGVQSPARQITVTDGETAPDDTPGGAASRQDTDGPVAGGQGTGGQNTDGRSHDVG